MIIKITTNRIEELKNEQKSLGLAENDRQINAKFQQLFKYTDIQSTPVLKAKLCLLVLSLPAYEMCQLTMQDASKVKANSILKFWKYRSLSISMRFSSKKLGFLSIQFLNVLSFNPLSA